MLIISFFTAALIFLTGGIHIAWSIGFDSSLSELEVTNHVQICWFIGAIIGALLGGFFSRWFPYKTLMVRKKVLFFNISAFVPIKIYNTYICFNMSRCTAVNEILVYPFRSSVR